MISINFVNDLKGNNLLNTKFSITLCNDDSQWDAFVSSSPHASPFCNNWFLFSLGVEVDRWFLIDKSNQIVAATVFLRKNGHIVQNPYHFTLYQGILLSEKIKTMPAHRVSKWKVDVIGEFVLQLSKHYSSLSFCFHPDLQDIRGLQWFRYDTSNRFQISIFYTAELSLKNFKNFEEYFQTIRSTRRYEYRTAKSKGLTSEFSHDIDTLDYLHSETFARPNIILSEDKRKLLRSIAQAALSAGTGEISITRTPTNQAASATLFIYDKHKVYYLISANAPELRNLYSGTYHMVENIRHYFDKGFHFIDFVGVNSPNRGDFKTSFGGIVKPYYVTTWNDSVII